MIRLARCCATCKFANFNKQNNWLKQNKNWLGLCMVDALDEEPPEIGEAPLITGNSALTNITEIRWELRNPGRVLLKETDTDKSIKLKRLTFEVYMARVRQHLLAKKETSSSDPDSQAWWEEKIEEQSEWAADWFEKVLDNYEWWKSRKGDIPLITRQNTCDRYEENPDKDKTARKIVAGDPKYRGITI